MERTIGAYPWTVHQIFDKERFGNLEGMRKWEAEENYKFLKSFNLKKGERISVQVGGTRKDKKLVWYTGTFDAIGRSPNYGNTLYIQQNVKARHIEGWSIADIKRV